MALASNKTIRQFADKLEKWAENLTYSTSSTKNLWVELNLSLYPRDMQDTVSWMADIPAIEKKITGQLEELFKLVQEVDAWRNHGIYPEDLEEFCARVDQLKQVNLNIIHILRKTSAAAGNKPPATEVTAIKKSDLPQTQESDPAGIKPDSVTSKMPRKEALTAYKLHYETGLTLPQIARRMTAELKLDKALRQWQISRWIKQVENQHIHKQIPVRSIAPRTSGTTARSAKTDAATQTESKKT